MGKNQTKEVLNTASINLLPFPNSNDLIQCKNYKNIETSNDE